jgi:signal transduction histidine kinase
MRTPVLMDGARPTKGSGARIVQVDIFLLVLVLAATLCVAGSIWLRAHYVSPGFVSKPATHGWVVTKISRDDTEGGLPASWVGNTLIKVCSVESPARCVALKPLWMTDSLTMATRSEIVDFVVGQQALLELAPTPGQRVLLHARQGTGAEGLPMRAEVTLMGAREFLNERYALMLIAATLVYTVGCAMLAFVRRSREVWTAFAMCAGFFFYMLARSWYTTRSWAQPELGWWIAIWVFRIGVLCCGTASVLSLWKLRLHGQRSWIPLGSSALFSVVVLLHSVGVIESTAWGYRYPTMGFLLVVVYIGIHAWRSRKTASPGERLRTKTTDIILLMGFVPLFITMPIWTFRPDLQQISYLQNIALGLAGIPAMIIVSRSERYQLHEFWWRLWLVLMAAVLALVAAAILVLLMGASAGVSLGLMLMGASMVIYSLRHWLEKRLIGSLPAVEHFLPQIMQMQAFQGDALEQSWRGLLVQAFAPKSVLVRHDDIDQVTLQHQGESLFIPSLGPAPAMLLTGAAQFTRSFGPADLRLASTLHTLVAQGLQARSSFLAGALQERRRIAADLHDDIGGKLLHLAGIGGAEGAFASNTLEDLRTITRGLSAQPRPLNELIADLRFQIGQRAERAELTLDWRCTLGDVEKNLLIGSRQSTVVVSICSELMRNAMQHPQVTQVGFAIDVSEAEVRISSFNDGQSTDPILWTHRLGTTSIRRRVHDLQGECTWLARAGGGVVFTTRWPLAIWIAAGAS